MGLLVAVLLLAAAGCGSDEPAAAPGATSPDSPPPSGSASPSASPSTVIEFSVDGAGPYQLGATLDSLRSAGSLDEVTSGGQECPENTTARGTGVWKDIRLSFHKDGQLYLVVNRSSSIPTPSGAWLGTPLQELKTIYAGVSGQDLTRASATAGSATPSPLTAYLVTTLSGRGILFDLDPSMKVMSMTAGEASYLRSSYVAGTTFC
jgi:hypothetical protein